MDPLAPPKSPLTSKTILGIVILLLPFLQQKTGLKFSDEDLQSIVEMIATIGGAVLGIYGRFAAKQPLTPIVAARDSATAMMIAIFTAFAAFYLAACEPKPECAAHTWRADPQRIGLRPEKTETRLAE